MRPVDLQGREATFDLQKATQKDYQIGSISLVKEGRLDASLQVDVRGLTVTAKQNR